MTQAKLFEEHRIAANLPEGMTYRAQLISGVHEKALLDHARQLPLKEFEFHGYKGKRRTVSFGWQYEFSGRGGLQKANDLPQFILPLHEVVAEFAQINPEYLQHVLVIRVWARRRYRMASRQGSVRGRHWCLAFLSMRDSL